MDGIYIDPHKVEAVLKWERPANVIVIISFLSFIVYYQRFIERFYKIEALLTILTQKDVKCEWDD